jgi:BCD family chlorophyll transporter-like MFS transporter
VGLDVARWLLGEVGAAFQLVFAVEAGAFVLAALLAVRATGAAAIRASAAQGTREQFA